MTNKRGYQFTVELLIDGVNPDTAVVDTDGLRDMIERVVQAEVTRLMQAARKYKLVENGIVLPTSVGEVLYETDYPVDG